MKDDEKTAESIRKADTLDLGEHRSYIAALEYILGVVGSAKPDDGGQARAQAAVSSE